jgi:hypothetical protein
VADSKFEVTWNRSRMRKQSELVAEDQGLQDKGQKDSFRHAYTSAKVAEKMDNVTLNSGIGAGVARVLGLGNELGLGTSFEDHVTDLANNEIGLMIREEVERDVVRMKEEWGLNDAQADEWRERLLRTRIADAVQSGKMTQKPFSGPQKDEE